VLDEATAALDSENEERVLRLVRRVLPGSLLVMVSHRSEVARYCSNLLTLKNKTIAYQGGMPNEPILFGDAEQRNNSLS
jgi:ABC-type bacteriocin/lantibiotic exporter with double-glycine peptidase domain